MYRVLMNKLDDSMVFAKLDGHPGHPSDWVNPQNHVKHAVLSTFVEAVKLANLVIENGYPRPIIVTRVTWNFCPIRKI